MCRCRSCLQKVTISSLCLASFLSVSSSSRWLMVPIPTCGYRRDAHGKKLQHKTELLLYCKLFHTFQRHHSIGFQNIVLLHVYVLQRRLFYLDLLHVLLCLNLLPRELQCMANNILLTTDIQVHVYILFMVCCYFAWNTAYALS